MAKMNAALGDLIRRKRRERSWTQGDLAQEVGVSQGLVSDWENGKALPHGRPVYTVLGVTSEEVTAAMATAMTDDPVEQALAATERVDPKVRDALCTLYLNLRNQADEDRVRAAVAPE